MTRVQLWFVAFVTINFFLSFPSCCWYVFTNYILGEIEMTGAEYWRMGVYSATINIFVTTWSWIAFAKLTRRPTWMGACYSVVNGVMGLLCLSVVPLAVGLLMLGRERRTSDDIETTLNQ